MRKTNKYLIFRSSEEFFAINIHQIVTIEKVEYEINTHNDPRLKKVNSYPSFVEGVFSFKNKVYPVIEFELFLNKKNMERHDENKIIFIRGLQKDVGILVNDVSTIVELNEELFEKIYDDVPVFITENQGLIIIVPDFDEILQQTEFPLVFDKLMEKVRNN